MEEPDVAGVQGSFDDVFGNAPGEIGAEFKRAPGFEGDGLLRGYCAHDGYDPWSVRLMTSSCCSRVSRTKFTAYPETRIVRLGYFSGWSMASRRVSRFNTLTFM